MRSPRLPARVACAYRGAPASDRIHVRVRWMTCPWDRLLPLVPRTGRVLDVGCGHGLGSYLLAADSPAREVVGVDIDRDKIAVAQRGTEGFGAGAPRFALADEEPWSDQRWDAVLVTDVLYLLPQPARDVLLADLIRAIAPGGTLVVKEIDKTPGWKHRLARVQERAATSSGVTEGDTVDFMDPDRLDRRLGDGGLAVRRVPMHAGYPHPHLAFVATAVDPPPGAGQPSR